MVQKLCRKKVDTPWSICQVFTVLENAEIDYSFIYFKIKIIPHWPRGNIKINSVYQARGVGEKRVEKIF